MILGRELFINNFQVVNNILRFSFQSQIILLNSSETLHFHTRGNIWNKRHCHHFFLAPVTVQNMGNAKTLDKSLASAVQSNCLPYILSHWNCCLVSLQNQKKIYAPFYHIFSFSVNFLFVCFCYVHFSFPFSLFLFLLSLFLPVFYVSIYIFLSFFLSFFFLSFFLSLFLQLFISALTIPACI